MPVTPTYGLRYQALSDAPDGAGLGEHLALDVEDQLARIDADIVTANTGVLTVGSLAPFFSSWTSYDPAITTTGGAFSIGNGTLAGAYINIGKMVVARVHLVIGSTTDVGSSKWFFDLPFTAASPAGLDHAIWVGAALIRDDSAGASGHLTGVVPIDAGFSNAVVCCNGLILGASATYFQMAVDDYMSFEVMYEKA